MTAKEIVEASLAALDIVIGWPIAILIVVLLFRKQIEYLFGILGDRLRRISVGGATAEFESSSLMELMDFVKLYVSNTPIDQQEDILEEGAPLDEGEGSSDTSEMLEQQRSRLSKERN